MSKIRGTNTTPEIIVRKFLFKNGFRFRIHQKKLIGKPDIVLKKHDTVIFIHGCFWHGHHNCKYYKIPKTRTKYWVAKIENNKIKDFRYKKELKQDGWKVLVVWECSLKSKKREPTLIQLCNNILR